MFRKTIRTGPVWHDMDRKDLIFTVKMTALGIAGLIVYIAVSLIRELR